MPSEREGERLRNRSPYMKGRCEPDEPRLGTAAAPIPRSATSLLLIVGTWGRLASPGRGFAREERGLRRERYCSRSGERAGEPGENAEVGVKRDLLRTRPKAPKMLLAEHEPPSALLNARRGLEVKEEERQVGEGVEIQTVEVGAGVDEPQPK